MEALRRVKTSLNLWKPYVVLMKPVMGLPVTTHTHAHFFYCLLFYEKTRKTFIFNLKNNNASLVTSPLNTLFGLIMGSFYSPQLIRFIVYFLLIHFY